MMKSKTLIDACAASDSYVLLGQRLGAAKNSIPLYIKPENAESLWPVGVFLPPVDVNDLGYSSHESRHMTPDFSNGLGEKC